jgi:IS5 family transposase
MRQTIERQMGLNQGPLEEMQPDLSSRHEMVPILVALRELYMEHPRRMEEILELIEKDIVGTKKKNRGRLGMTIWEILVLAGVKQGCDMDYDALQDLANNHIRLRQLMGCQPHKTFGQSTIHRNLAKVKTETIQALSEHVVAIGHQHKPKAIEKVRGDAFVCQTNIHYPTDANLMADGIRVMLRIVARLSDNLGLGGWRQHQHLSDKARRMVRRIERASRKIPDALQQHYQEYIHYVRGLQTRVAETLQESQGLLDSLPFVERIVAEDDIKTLQHFMELTNYVTHLAERRVIFGESIPNKEKLLSLFEVHTQLIKRGKKPDIPEFGRQVFVVEDAVGFILKSKVLKPEEDPHNIVVPVFTELQEQYQGHIKSASVDRGCFSKENRDQLQQILSVACVPKPGRLNQQDLVFETNEQFVKARQRHPGIESAIHALMDGNGLRRCRDKGEERYERYIALASLGRNLHTLGRLLIRKRQKSAKTSPVSLAA